MKKDETDAVSDEASNISLELQTSEECNRHNDEKGNVRMYKIFDPKYTTLMMKTAVGAKITTE